MRAARTLALAILAAALASCRHTAPPAPSTKHRLEVRDAITRMHLNTLYERRRIDPEGLGNLHGWGIGSRVWEDLSEATYAAARRALEGDPQRGEIERRLRGASVAQRLDAQEPVFVEDKTLSEAAAALASRHAGVAELLRTWPEALRLPDSPEIVVTAAKVLPRRYLDDAGVLRDGCEVGIWARRGTRECVRYGQVVWVVGGWEFRETEGEGQLY